MNFKCILFDCDGVLVDSEIISARILVDMARKLGVEFNMPLIKAVNMFSGVSLKYSLSIIKEKFKEDLPENFEAEFRQLTYNAFRSELKPVKGITSLLKDCKYPYGVASSGPRDKIELNLRITGLYTLFKGRIFSSYDINSWKPDPDIFLYAAKEMGFQPGDCLVIEDSEAGVIAAKAGGFSVLGFANCNNEELLLKAGAVTFRSMDEIRSLITNIKA